MKKVLSVLAAAAVLSVAAGAMASSIVNTKHDLSSGNTTSPYRSNTSQVCVFCHTPHNTAQTRALWNRKNSAGTFTLYTSGANVEDVTWYVGSNKNTLPASSPSLLCLTCHDGTTTLGGSVKTPPIGSDDAHMTNLATIAPTDTIGGGASLGTALTNDHPISLIYDNVYATLGNTKLVQSNSGSVGGLPLAKGQNLECNTCHNVHDNAYIPFLRMSNDRSALCLACHVK